MNSGFLVKKLDSIEPQSQQTINLIIRATVQTNLDKIDFLFVYSSKGFLRTFLIQVKMKISSSFKIKCILEKLDFQNYLVCINVFDSNDKKFNKDCFSLKKLILLSNTMRIDTYPVTIQDFNKDLLGNLNLLYLTIKDPMASMQSKSVNTNFSKFILNQTETDINFFDSFIDQTNQLTNQTQPENKIDQQEVDFLTTSNVVVKQNDRMIKRKDKIIFYDPKNIITFKDSMKNEEEKDLMGFLDQENSSIKNDYKNMELKILKHKKDVTFLCKDFLDFELLWEYKDKEEEGVE